MHKFFNILAKFPAPRRAQTTNSKEVNISLQIIDIDVNFKYIWVIRGTCSINRTWNLIFKIPGAGDTQSLRFTGRYLYIQSQIPRKAQSANSLVLEVYMNDNSIHKFIFGSLYNTSKTSGNSIYLPFEIRGGSLSQIQSQLKLLYLQ
ncbi:MAG: hypothetical protein EZS28_037784 [Streblomastix strix]|uniref:Uncharacterized protein n=1 Tax=Streblomastix strix TaxID=222440 RepID=A0A5J4U8F6_9EUKA|nr:MAG: hypothetical protein EZS28_037784 [Streblomastix strix]